MAWPKQKRPNYIGGTNHPPRKAHTVQNRYRARQMETAWCWGKLSHTRSSNQHSCLTVNNRCRGGLWGLNPHHGTTHVSRFRTVQTLPSQAQWRAQLVGHGWRCSYNLLLLLPHTATRSLTSSLTSCLLQLCLESSIHRMAAIIRANKSCFMGDKYNCSPFVRCTEPI